MEKAIEFIIGRIRECQKPDGLFKRVRLRNLSFNQTQVGWLLFSCLLGCNLARPDGDD